MAAFVEHTPVPPDTAHAHSFPAHRQQNSQQNSQQNGQQTLGNRNSSHAPVLSAPDLRTSLVEHLTLTGAASRLKSQLRAKLYAELRLRAVAVSVQDSNATSSISSSLLFKVVDSLLLGYLQERRLDFTLSVFVPEAGLCQPREALSDSDIMHALHLDRPCAAFRDMMSAVRGAHQAADLQRQPRQLASSDGHHAANHPSQPSLLVRLLDGLAKVNDVPRTEKEVQTNTDLEDILNTKINDIERSIMQQRHESARVKSGIIEDRLFQYQQQLELRMTEDTHAQIARFKEIELAQMRLDERKAFQSEIMRQKADFEQKLLDAQQNIVNSQESERRRLGEKERELERQNLELRQKLLDENNRIVLKEVHLRNEAELQAKEVRLERDMLQRRFEQVQQQVAELQAFKERYTQKMEESMTLYKIELNKEHSAMISGVEIKRAKLDAERMLLKEKSSTVERMHAAAVAAEDEREALRASLKQAQAQVDAMSRERDEAHFQIKELQLELLTRQGSTAVEFEISSLKKQLIETEKMAEKRQEEYQSLLKSLMTPKDDVRQELSKARDAEAKWQRECQQLVTKLDLELNRTDELQRRLDDEILKNRELQRELADMRLLLNQTQTALTTELAHHSVPSHARTPRIVDGYAPRDLLPDPLDPHLDCVYSRLAAKQPKDQLNADYLAYMVDAGHQVHQPVESSPFAQSSKPEEGILPRALAGSYQHKVDERQFANDALHFASPPQQHVQPSRMLQDQQVSNLPTLPLPFTVSATSHVTGLLPLPLASKPAAASNSGLDTQQYALSSSFPTGVSPPSDTLPSPSAEAAQAKQGALASGPQLKVAQQLPDPVIAATVPAATVNDQQAAGAVDEAEAPKRMQEDRLQREIERRQQELQERERIQREREEMARIEQEAQKQRQLRLEQEQKDEAERLLAESQRKEVELQVPANKSREETARRQQDQQPVQHAGQQEASVAQESSNNLAQIDSLENDPFMQKYMALVKERREQQAKAGSQDNPIQSRFEVGMPEAKNVAHSPSSSAHSDGLAGGNTEDEVSAPHDDTSESLPSW